MHLDSECVLANFFILKSLRLVNVNLKQLKLFVSLKLKIVFT